MVTQGNWWMWEAKRKNEVISKGTSSFSFCLSFDFWIQSNKRPQRRKTLADWLGGLVETNRNNIFCTNNQPATRSLFNNLRWITLFNLFFICFFFFGYSTRVDCHFFFHKFADDVVRSPRSLAFQIMNCNVRWHLVSRSNLNVHSNLIPWLEFEPNRNSCLET